MAIIYTYPDLGAVDGTERFLVSDSNDNTKTVTTAVFGAYINATYGEGISLYTTDDSLTSDRTLSGVGKYLHLDNLSNFTVGTTGAINLNPGTAVAIGADKKITVAGSTPTSTTYALEDRDDALNSFYWLYRVSGMVGTFSSSGGINIIAQGATNGVEIQAGANSYTTLINGVPLLTGANNDIADIDAGLAKTLVTKEWVAFTYPGTVTDVTASVPITSSGGATPDIGLNIKANSGLVLDTNDLSMDLSASSITGTLAIGDGGTGQSTRQTAIDALTDATSGSNGDLLTIVAGNAQWATPPGGGTGTVTSITHAADSGSGTAITTSGTFTFTGGTNVNTSVSGTTVTIDADNLYNTDGTISGARTVTNAGNLRFTGTGLGTTTIFDNKAGYGFSNNASMTIDNSAVMQVDSSTRGFLPPRMTTAEMNAVSTPATGLMVYDTTTNQWMGYNGTSWVIIG